MIDMTALINKRKMRDDENFRLTKNNLMIDMTALIIKRRMRDDDKRMMGDDKNFKFTRKKVDDNIDYRKKDER